VTTFYLIVAALGFGLVIIGLVFDDVLDGLTDAFDVDGGGILSAPVIGAFLGAFGIGGWAATSASDNTFVGLVVALLAGLLLGYVALKLSLALLDMHTDATPTSDDFRGQLGRVVTPISGGTGEVMVRLGGSPRKLTARCDSDVERGAEVAVIEVLSPNAVRVIPTSEMFDQEK